MICFKLSTSQVNGHLGMTSAETWWVVIEKQLENTIHTTVSCLNCPRAVLLKLSHPNMGCALQVQLL